MGRATALAFAREGACVVIGDVAEAAGEGLVREGNELAGRIIYQHCDVSREADVIALIALAEERTGRLDTIFNNAGIEQPVTPSIDTGNW